ncbi:MAG TPA: KTSC domain-containing protein [Armatimonadota bacterium]|nr:KTSC domain-containing protein [Armatimonadota bacterium]
MNEEGMERKAVRSTNVASVGYDPKNKVLEIAFKSGGVYQYSGVPVQRHQKLMKASSIGHYFTRDIRPWYSCRKVG